MIDSTLPMQGVRVQSLVGELRSCMPCGLAQPTNQPTSWLPRAATAKEQLAVWWQLGQEFWRGPMPRGHPSFWWGLDARGEGFPLDPECCPEWAHPCRLQDCLRPQEGISWLSLPLVLSLKLPDVRASPPRRVRSPLGLVCSAQGSYAAGPLGQES